MDDGCNLPLMALGEKHLLSNYANIMHIQLICIMACIKANYNILNIISHSNMRHNTKKGSTRFKSKRHGKTRRVQRGGAPIPIYDENQNPIGEYDDETGEGRAVYPGVGVYVGHFENGVPHGEGTLEYDDGGVYTGAWVEDMPCGYGVMTYANGNIYEGNWVANDRNGHGVMTYANGDVYTGAWSSPMDGSDVEWSNEKNGQGIMTYANGDVYTGAWSNGERNGQGKLTFDDRRVYEGNWLDDKMHGQGTMTDANGDVIYEGHWINQGVYEGALKDGFANGRGKCTFINGDVYEGEWDANYMHGPGKMTYANGDVYEGPWRRDERHGENGRMRYADDGRVYEGEWWKDKMHGDGTLTAANGDVIYEGLWRNDRQIPVFFDPATGKLTDNDGYNPPAPIMRFINSDNMLFTDNKFKRQYEFRDLIYNKEKNVSDELEEDPTTIALLLNRTYYVPTAERLLQLMNDRRLIRYECIKIDTDKNFSIDTDVEKTVPYFSLNGLVSHQGGVVPLFDLWAAIKSGHRAFELIKTGRKLLTVASHHVAYDYGSWVSGTHCQHDKDADIYELRILRISQRPRSRNKTRKNRLSSNSHRSISSV